MSQVVYLGNNDVEFNLVLLCGVGFVQSWVGLFNRIVNMLDTSDSKAWQGFMHGFIKELS